MFGFENLKQNSYEQLIINTANEELQNVFYRHVFEYDQQNYQKEGIPYPPMMHKENSKTLELLLQVHHRRLKFQRVRNVYLFLFVTI